MLVCGDSTGKLYLLRLKDSVLRASPSERPLQRRASSHVLSLMRQHSISPGGPLSRATSGMSVGSMMLPGAPNVALATAAIRRRVQLTRRNSQQLSLADRSAGSLDAGAATERSPGAGGQTARTPTLSQKYCACPVVSRVIADLTCMLCVAAAAAAMALERVSFPDVTPARLLLPLPPEVTPRGDIQTALECIGIRPDRVRLLARSASAAAALHAPAAQVKAVVCVFGGASGLHDLLVPTLAATVQHGVVRAAVQAAAMVVDGGTRSGVMRMVGDSAALLPEEDRAAFTILGVAPRGARCAAVRCLPRALLTPSSPTRPCLPPRVARAQGA